MARPRILVSAGQVFGRLTVIDWFPGPSDTMIRVRCECGSERVVTSSNLRKGNSTSCGCSRLKGRRPLTQSVIAWQGAKRRCFSPTDINYRNYGGRGITMCVEWAADFNAFTRDMGQPPSSEHTLDRIDNDGPYAPGNCRWATRKQQCNNKRNNRRITIGPNTRTLHEWSDLTGIPYHRLHQRIETLGWTLEKAISVGKYDSLRRITDADRAAVKMRHASGESQRAIANSLGLDQSTISRVVSGRKRVSLRASGT